MNRRQKCRSFLVASFLGSATALVATLLCPATASAGGPSGSVGWWRGEGNANDAVGTNHGTLQNGATFAAGMVGQAFSLDGTDDYVGGMGTPSTFSFIQNTGVFTIDAWIKLDNPSAIGEQAITANTSTTIEKGYYFIWDNSTGQQQLRLVLMKGESGNPVINSGSANQVITNSNWHHIAAVGNGTGITFYVDGTAYPGSGVMGSKPSGDATRAVDIGRCPPTTPHCQFSGRIDELAIYNRALSASEILAIYNAGAAGKCALSINDVTVTEGNTGTVNATFTVSLTTPSGSAVSVSYATANGTATTANNDYVAGSGVLTIPAEGLSTTVTVVVNGDLVDEGNETFAVNLSGAVNATIADAQGQGTITDDDGMPSLSIGDVTVTEGNSGTVDAVFTVSLSTPSGSAVSVSYATANGTATTANNDYLAGSGTLTIPAKATSGTITVAVNGDGTQEANETFLVNLTSPVNATIADGTGQGTITNDDANLSISDAEVTEGNSGTVNATFTVSLLAPSNNDVTVHYQTQDLSATAGNDYAAASGTATIPAQSLSTTLTVVVNGDVTDCETEYFRVLLSNVTGGATIVDGVGTGTILSDDGAASLDYDDSAPITLTWDDCYYGAYSTFKSTSCNSNSGTNTLIASFVAPPNVSELVALRAEIEIIGAAGLPAWWEFGSGGCRATSLSVSCLFLTELSCVDPWQGQASATKSYELGFGGDPARARLGVSCQLPNGFPGAPLAPDEIYYAFKVQLGNNKSTGLGSCAGCSTPVKIVLRSIQLFQPASAGYDPILALPSDYPSNTVGWQGGGGAAPPAGNFSINDVTVSEAASEAIFTVTRTTFDSRSPLFYTTSDGTASAGADYAASSGTILFPLGADSVTVTVPLNPDGVNEDDETFFVDLSCGPSLASFSRIRGQATIVDNEVTDVPQSPGFVPTQLVLEAPRPNPMRGEVQMPFGLPRRGRVTLRIYDTSGRLVRTLIDETREAGSFRERWDGTLAAGAPAAPGVYLCELRAAGEQRTKRLVLAR